MVFGDPPLSSSPFHLLVENPIQGEFLPLEYYSTIYSPFQGFDRSPDSAEKCSVCSLINDKMMTAEQNEKQKMVLPVLQIDTVNKTSSSTPASPMALRKSLSVKYSCLCSPTTHAGSFRCRYHRNILSHGMSVGSKLSELAGSNSVDSKLSKLAAKPTQLSDPLHAQ